MRLWIFSDLHLVARGPDFEVEPPDADLCVVAGDVCGTVRDSITWLAQRVLPHMPVVLVPGNHEFYRTSISEELAAGRVAAAGHPGLHLLSNDVLVLGRYRVLGTTLWTDYRLAGAPGPAMAAAASMMTDHELVALTRRPWQRFRPEDARRLHAAARSWLQDRLDEPFGGPTVVVSHHAPHPGSVHPRWVGDPITPAFVSDLSDVIEAWHPELWVHGHTHDRFDYTVGATRVLCNPRGYGRENPGFDPALVVEV